MSIELTKGEIRRNAWFAWTGAAVALTGAQMISPSLPVMRDTLNLTDGQLGLVMSVYLLPAAVATIPLGMLADRIGRRIVFGGGLLVFGLCGLLLVSVSSFTFFLAIRLLQGVAFAGLLPLTMTILGDVFSGAELVGAQGRRSVAMALGDGIWPMIGGLLATIAWFVPWFGQTLAIPLGIAVLLKLVDVPTLGGSRAHPGIRLLLRVFRDRAILSLQYAGFLRMFLKFCILTFIPVFLVDVRSQTPAFAGLVVGGAALAGAAIASIAGRLARLGRPTAWVVAGTLVMGSSLIAMVTLPWPWAILMASLSYGTADGMMGVFTNSLVTVATGSKGRATFVSATGAIRNLAKFVAPIAFAALTFQTSINYSFVIIGCLAIVSSFALIPMRSLDNRIDRSLKV